MQKNCAIFFKKVTVSGCQLDAYSIFPKLGKFSRVHNYSFLTVFGTTLFCKQLMNGSLSACQTFKALLILEGYSRPRGKSKNIQSEIIQNCSTQTKQQ